MNKIVKRIKCWYKWQKHCLNSMPYKFLVLIGFIHSPTLEPILMWQEGVNLDIPWGSKQIADQEDEHGAENKN